MSRRKRHGEERGRDKVDGSGKTVIRYRRHMVHPLEFRVRLVREVLEGKASPTEICRIFGINKATLYHWIKRYELGGIEGLAPRVVGPKPKPTAAATAKRKAVTELRREHPEYGTRRISDVLRRFQALGVSETVVRRILREEGLLLDRAGQRPAREHPPRRFERAMPNQLWQSDIFTFLLRRHERLYLAAFMDDHSRFIVSYALAHRQRAELVMEALDRGIAEYGTPREILTDQGRQYVSWRGRTAFVEELRRQGIEHIKSRPQHPQTLGKIERFWKTLWEEFLSRTVFGDFADCDRRLRLYIDGYNFQRPHQGIEGMTPADRFFRLAPQVRAAVEQAVAKNAGRLALERPAQKPFYLVGRLGDQDLTIAAGGSGLQVQMGDVKQTIALPKERDDEEPSIPPRIRREEGRGEEETPGAPDSEVAARRAGTGRDRATAVPAGAGGAIGGAAGDGRAGGSPAVAGDVLQAGRAGAGRDDAGAVAGGGSGWDGWPGTGGGAFADGGAGSEAAAGGEGEAALGQAGLPDEEAGEGGPADDGRGPVTGEPEPPALDDGWAEAFARVEALGERGGDDASGRERFDPDGGWRDRALSWERKLAGATAPGDAADAEVEHGQEGQEDGDVHAGAGDRSGRGAASAGGAEGDHAAVDGDAGGGRSGDEPQPLPNADASEHRRGAGGAWPEAGWATGAAGAGEGALGGERAPATRERSPVGPGGDDRPPAGRGERHDQGAHHDERAAGEDEAELVVDVLEWDGGGQ
jgi:transposase InsO family protein